jgi:GntR family transcriptional regulator/MocR family aminotransferase
MRGVYQKRHDMIVDFVTHELAGHLQLIPSAAGLHVTATAHTASADIMAAVLRRAAAAGVRAQSLSAFYHGTQGQPGLVLGYGAIPTAHIPEGLRRLRQSFQN